MCDTDLAITQLHKYGNEHMKTTIEVSSYSRQASAQIRTRKQKIMVPCIEDQMRCVFIRLLDMREQEDKLCKVADLNNTSSSVPVF